MWIHDHPGRAATAGTEDAGIALQAWLADWTTRIAIPRNFWAEARANRAVGNALYDALGEWGYDVSFQGRYRNVVALPARRGPEPIVLVGAHYDSVARCPGADDNASGIAVLLACAHALAGAGRPVGFVAFNAEEDGLLGSQEFVQSGLAELGVKPSLVHVLEMVGFRACGADSQELPIPWPSRALRTGDFISVIANRAARSVLADLLRSRAAPKPRCVGVQQWVAMDSLVPALRRSDHFPFWQRDVAALLWTDTAEFRNPNYHRGSDTPETLDYAFMAEVTSLLVASLHG